MKHTILAAFPFLIWLIARTIKATLDTALSGFVIKLLGLLWTITTSTTL